MKVFKPLQLSLQTKVFQWQKKNHLAVTLLLGFPFDDNQEVLLEQELWGFLAEQLGKDAMLDMCMPKARGEALVYGSYYAAGVKPVTADRVQLTIGDVDKTLAVIGNRYWRTLLGPTEPEPFTEMPISYENAFGGKDFNPNPTGKGIDEVDVDGEMRVPMPNIENPDRLMTSTSQRPDPAGFAPIDMMWQQRVSKMGTYDDKWLQEYAPGFPSDLDWRFFNVAAEDQWTREYWSGNEDFAVLNMHPEKSQVEGRLPDFRTRCFVDQKQDKEFRFREINMQAETVFLFPHCETGVMLYRGNIEVADHLGRDVEHLLMAYENLDQSPKPMDYYEEALRNRLDEKKQLRYMMSTKDIIPETERCGFARLLDEAGGEGDSLLGENMQARAEAEKDKALQILDEKKDALKAQLEAAGIDPAPYIEKFKIQDPAEIDDPYLKAIMEIFEQMLPGVTSGDSSQYKIEEIDFSKFEELTKKIEEMAEATKQQVRDKLLAFAKQAEGGAAKELVRQQVDEALQKMDELPALPRPDASLLDALGQQLDKIEAVKQQLRTQGISEDALPEIGIDLEATRHKLEEGVTQMKDMYLQGAQYIEGKPPHDIPMDIVQHRFNKAHASGRPLAGGDYAGIDLSGRDLSGVDLSGSYLEYVNFSNAKLCGANLSRAVVTHANLSNADLTDANLEESNLGGSLCAGAMLNRVNLKNGTLSKANLSNASLIDCNLDEVNFLEAKMAGVNMSGSRTTGANFLEMDFSNGKFIGADFKECNFLQSTLQHTDFSDANLSGCNFVECNLDNSRFYNARMANVRFPSGCSLKNCNFDKAVLNKANCRGIDAENSCFEEASFHSADFSEANLKKTKFYGAQGKRALFMSADLAQADFTSVNLMEGSLMDARLTSADLSYCNLYSVDFMNSTVGDTDFTGANLDMTRLEGWRPSR